jgi:hypothetical protein
MDFEMRTGEFSVDYSIRGRLVAELTAGATITPKTTKAGGPLRPIGTVADAGTIMHIAALGDSGRAEAFAVGADGALHHRSLTPESPRHDGDWRRIELPGSGSGDVAVAAGTDSLDLVFRGDDGGVHHQRVDRRRPKVGKWRRLGGDFQAVVPAAGKDGSAVLFGIARDGLLYVSDAGGNWDRLGDETVSAIAPLASDRSGPALLAAMSNGGVTHFARAGARWKSRPLAPLPAKSGAQLLSTATTSSVDAKGKARPGDLIIAAMDEAHRVRALRWPDYPAGEPEGRWDDLGPVQDLLTSAPDRSQRKAKSLAKPPAAKRR